MIKKISVDELKRDMWIYMVFHGTVHYIKHSLDQTDDQIRYYDIVVENVYGHRYSIAHNKIHELYHVEKPKLNFDPMQIEIGDAVKFRGDAREIGSCVVESITNYKIRMLHCKNACQYDFRWSDIDYLKFMHINHDIKRVQSDTTIGERINCKHLGWHGGMATILKSDIIGENIVCASFITDEGMISKNHIMRLEVLSWIIDNSRVNA